MPYAPLFVIFVVIPCTPFFVMCFCNVFCNFVFLEGHMLLSKFAELTDHLVFGNVSYMFVEQE